VTPRRLLKTAFYLAYVYLYAAPRDLILAILGRSWIVVLTYHSVGGQDAVTKPLADFRREIAFLRRTCRCIGMAEVCARLRSRTPLRSRYRAVTFDDGYQDNFITALPVLAEAGVPATFFVATGFVDTTALLPYHAELSPEQLEKRNPRPSNLTWGNLRDMQSVGYEIGSHTVRHVNLALADRETLKAEVRDSLEVLNRELGARDRAFAFPWGRPGFVSAEAVAEIKRAGYYGAVTASGGVNRRGTDLFDIRRIDVGNGNLRWLEVRARMAGFEPDHLRRRWRALLGLTFSPERNCATHPNAQDSLRRSPHTGSPWPGD
jgi:peptidoglycan/xylan/chitin deacetylase (PgdA/CDA1 family)